MSGDPISIEIESFGPKVEGSLREQHILGFSIALKQKLINHDPQAKFNFLSIFGKF